MVLFVPCKINLGLNITSRRSDGYHQIESVMIPIEKLCDVVEVLPIKEGVTFESSGIAMDCPPEENLCVKAYHEFAKHYPIGGVAISLLKKIPFGAGLGGGSSDAVAVLKAINAIYQCGATTSQLERMAAALGSDTSFFVESKPALCTGRGEVLTPVSVDLKGVHITIVKPDIHISTKVAYSGVTPKSDVEKIEKIISLPLEQWKGVLKNDFEDSLFGAFGQLKAIKCALYDLGAEYVSLSGSGSSIYALSRQFVDTDAKAEFEGMFIFHNIL